MSENKTPKKKRNSKQIVALSGVILLAAVYIFTLIVAIFFPGESGNLFKGCILATIVLPALVWIYVWLYGKITNRHTIANPDSSLTEDSSWEE